MSRSSYAFHRCGHCQVNTRSKHWDACTLSFKSVPITTMFWERGGMPEGGADLILLYHECVKFSQPFTWELILGLIWLYTGEEHLQSAQPFSSMTRDSKTLEMTKAYRVREFIMWASMTTPKITRGKTEMFAQVQRKSWSPQQWNRILLSLYSIQSKQNCPAIWHCVASELNKGEKGRKSFYIYIA